MAQFTTRNTQQAYRKNHKRGSVFRFDAEIIDQSTGLPLDLTTIPIRSKMVDEEGVLVSEAIITKTTLGRFVLEVLNTNHWIEHTVLYWDIALDIDGVSDATQETVEINVLPKVT